MTRRPDRFLLLGALLIAAQLGFRAWALWGSWFYFDDLAFMSRAMNQSFGIDYLTESYGGHLMPAGFAVAWVMTKWWVYDWAPWAVSLLLLQLAAAVAVFRLLVAMFGRRPLVLALLALYLTWVFTLPAGVWWAAGINQFPLQIALGFGLTAFLGYLRTERVGQLVAALAWVCFGLLFYEKSVIVLAIYGVVALGWFATGHTPDRLREVWDRYRPAVIAAAALGVVYLAVYAKVGLEVGSTQAAQGSWGPIAWDLVAVALLPAVAGGPVTWEALGAGSLADPSALVMVVAWAAVAGLVAYAWRTRTLSGRAWWLVALMAVGNLVLLATARAGVVGPDIAREYRYQTEMAAVVVLAIGLAFLPLVGARESNAVREGAGAERASLVALLTVLVVVGATVSSLRYVHQWQSDNPSKAYFDNVEQSLTSAADPVPLVDAGVPQSLLWSFRYPENTYSHLFRPWEKHYTFPESSVDDLEIFDDSGRLTEAQLMPARLMELSDDEEPGCAYPLQGGVLSIPLDGPVLGDGWWIAMDYTSPVDTRFRVVAGDQAHDITAPAGKHTVWMQASGTFDEVKLNSFPEDTGLCITDLRLGTAVPGDPVDGS